MSQLYDVPAGRTTARLLQGYAGYRSGAPEPPGPAPPASAAIG
jgi:hypothetical protein